MVKIFNCQFSDPLATPSARNFCHQKFLPFFGTRSPDPPPFIFFKNKFFKNILFFLCKAWAFVFGIHITLLHILFKIHLFLKKVTTVVSKSGIFCKKQGFYFKNIEKNIVVNILCCTLLDWCNTRLLASQTEKTIEKLKKCDILSQFTAYVSTFLYNELLNSKCTLRTTFSGMVSVFVRKCRKKKFFSQVLLVWFSIICLNFKFFWEILLEKHYIA